MNFDDWLKAELAPPDQAEDHVFAARMTLLATLDARRVRIRAAALRNLTLQLVGLATIAAALALILGSVMPRQEIDTVAALPFLLAILSLCLWTIIAARPGRWRSAFG